MPRYPKQQSSRSMRRDAQKTKEGVLIRNKNQVELVPTLALDEMSDEDATPGEGSMSGPVWLDVIAGMDGSVAVNAKKLHTAVLKIIQPYKDRISELLEN